MKLPEKQIPAAFYDAEEKDQIFIKSEKQEKHLEFKPWITDLHICNN